MQCVESIVVKTIKIIHDQKDVKDMEALCQCAVRDGGLRNCSLTCVVFVQENV